MTDLPAPRQLIDLYKEQLEARLRWELHLHTNEIMFGSAYGPWPDPSPFHSITDLINHYHLHDEL